MARVGYRDCVVSFVDVLGFKSLLNSHKEPHEISRIIRKVRDALNNNHQSHSISDPKGLRSSKAFGFSLSDAVVRIRPYDTEFRDGALFYEILDLMHAQGQLLFDGIIVRGAVTVGQAYAHRSDDMAFGPAVVEAYQWESTRAVYPRIVVTERALQAYRDDKRLRADSERSETMNLLKQGDDGLHFIDYLNKMSTEFDHYGSYLEMLQKHKEVIEKNLSEQEKGSPVWQKYSWMKIQHNRIVRRLSLSAKNDASRQAFYEEFETEMEPFVRRLRVV